MSDTTNEHVKVIRDRCKLARNRGSRPMWGEPVFHIARSYLADIENHADALADELAEATARAAKLRRYALAWEDDFREGFATKELADPRMQEFVENTIQIMRGHSGIDDDLMVEHADLAAAPGDTEGE